MNQIFNKHDLTIEKKSQWKLLKKDIFSSLKLWRLWTHLGWGDILKQYRRSFLGPLWISLNSAIFIIIFSLIGAQLFNFSISTYLSYFCLGHVIFSFFSATVSEGCQTYISAEAFLKQVPYPKITFVFRVVWRNLLMLAHNLPIVIGVLWWSGMISKIMLGWFIVGLLTTVFAATLAVSLLGAVAARFRDVPMIITSIMQISFFLTPVMWKTEQLTERAQLIVHLNPLAAYLEIVRSPLLGIVPSSEAWMLAIGTIIVLIALFFIVYIKVRKRITYWL